MAELGTMNNLLCLRGLSMNIGCMTSDFQSFVSTLPVLHITMEEQIKTKNDWSDGTCICDLIAAAANDPESSHVRSNFNDERLWQQDNIITTWSCVAARTSECLSRLCSQQICLLLLQGKEGSVQGKLWHCSPCTAVCANCSGQHSSHSAGRLG